MSSKTVYLITGANRGIGLFLTALLLARTNTMVIGTVRSSTTSIDDLNILSKAEGSQLIIAHLSTDASASPESLLETLTNSHNTTHIDTLICNAASSTFTPLLQVTTAEVLESLHINTILPIKLFQTLYPLLEKSENPKFVYLSSYLGSIGSLDGSGETPTLSYGLSKAAGGYFTRKLHFQFPKLVSIAIHPGWIQTDFGQQFADSIGVAQPPQELDDAVPSVLKQIDSATKETTSGKFVRWDGDAMAW